MQWSGVGNHARYLLVVAVGDKQGSAQLALRLWRFRSKDVPRLRLTPLDFAGASLAEALGRARMGFQLGHFLLFLDGVCWLPHKVHGRRDFPVPLTLASVYRKAGFDAISAPKRPLLLEGKSFTYSKISRRESSKITRRESKRQHALATLNL